MMSVPVLILADSGKGKSRSMKNLDPQETLLVQPIRKPLPFRAKEWAKVSRDSQGMLTGSIVQTSEYGKIKAVISAAVKAGKTTIVIDDSNYLMTVAEIRRCEEKGYGKFTEFAKNHFDLVVFLQSLPDDVTVYVMSHTQLDMHGHSKPKTTGKMLDEKICVEGLFSIVLGCHESEGRHYFSTKTQGGDCAKTPEGMFDSDEIDNDLAIVNEAIRNYY